jgi:isoleucyl-tRNA synthetase
VKDLIPGSVKQLEEDWEQLLAVRTEVNGALEDQRKAGRIGKSLETTVEIDANPELYPILKNYEPSLPELFMVSGVTLGQLGPDTFRQATEVSLATDPKCKRCWRYVPDVGNEANHPTVCLRCAEALAAIGFPPYTAEGEKGAAE